MKKLTISIFTLIFMFLILLLTSCEDSKNFKILKIGTFAIPDGQILHYIADDLKKQGIKLKIIKYGSYSCPSEEELKIRKINWEKKLGKLNQDLIEGKLDANFCQSTDFIKYSYKKEYKNNLFPIAKIYFAPMKMLSPKYYSVKKIPDKAVIIIRKEPIHKCYALWILKTLGLINFKNNLYFRFNPNSCIDNPKHLKIICKNIKELGDITNILLSKSNLKLKKFHQFSKLPSKLKNIDFIFIHPIDVSTEYLANNWSKHMITGSPHGIVNMYKEEDLKKHFDYLIYKNSIFIENWKIWPFNEAINSLVINKKDKNKPELKALAKILTSKKVANFINKKYNKLIVPVN